MAENTRICHAVGFDMHGVLVERAIAGDYTKNPEEIFRVSQKNAMRRFVEAVTEILGEKASAIEIDESQFWLAEQRAWNSVSRQDLDSDTPLGQAEFVVRVNIQIFETVCPDLFAISSMAEKRQIAEAIRKLRHQDSSTFKIYPDIIALLEWLQKKYRAPVHLVTGKEKGRVEGLLRKCAVPQGLLTGELFTSDQLGANKLCLEFWQQILQKLGLEPHQFLMIGNDVVIDGSCTMAKISVIILDRSGEIQGYYSRNNTRYGVRLLSGPEEEIPPKAPFIGFAHKPCEIKAWLKKMLAKPAEE